MVETAERDKPHVARNTQIERAWEALAAIPDPELPIVSIVELGIVRSIRAARDGLVVDVTPTYSACPAIEAIIRDIRDALDESGIGGARIELKLSPPWTSDCIAPEAKNRLRQFGIAPPHAAVARIDVTRIRPLRHAAAVACPRCASTHTRRVSEFGSTPCKAHYRCDDCLEPFDYFKPL